MRVLMAPNPEGPRVNPYLRLLAESLAAVDVEVVGWPSWRDSPDLAGVDLLHVHWPEMLARTRFSGRAVQFVADRRTDQLLGRLAKRVPVVWTAHNLGAHDEQRPPVVRRYAWLAERAQAVIAFEEATCELVEERHPSLAGRANRVPHGELLGLHGPILDAAEARAELGVPSDVAVILWFGQVRPYKGLASAVASLRPLLLSGKVHLVVAGRRVGGMAPISALDEVEAAGAATVIDRRIEDDEVRVIFGAADLALLTYRDILHSGVAYLAASFGTPMLVPAMGALKSMAQQLPAGAVHLYADIVTPRDVTDALESARPGYEYPVDWSWLAVGTATKRVYEQARDRGPR